VTRPLSSSFLGSLFFTEELEDFFIGKNSFQSDDFFHERNNFFRDFLQCAPSLSFRPSSVGIFRVFFSTHLTVHCLPFSARSYGISLPPLKLVPRRWAFFPFDIAQDLSLPSFPELSNLFFWFFEAPAAPQNKSTPLAQFLNSILFPLFCSRNRLSIFPPRLFSSFFARRG